MRKPPAPALRALALALALAAGAAGCNTDFPPQYLVTDLRILAIRARVQGTARADPVPGDTLVLESLVLNPAGRAGLSLGWYVCLPLPDQTLLPCNDPAFLSDLSRLDSDPRVVRLGAGASVSLPLTYDPANPADPLLRATQFNLDTAVQSPAYRCRAYTEVPVVLVARADGFAPQIALKRVRVWPTAAQLAATGIQAELAVDVNDNPALGDVRRAPDDRDTCTGGVSLSTPPFPLGETPLCGVPAAGAAQPFHTCDRDGISGSQPEDLSWQWYVDAGRFPRFGGVGNANGADVDFDRPDGTFTLWAILRDGRGGTAWQAWTIP